MEKSNNRRFKKSGNNDQKTSFNKGDKHPFKRTSSKEETGKKRSYSREKPKESNDSGHKERRNFKDKDKEFHPGNREKKPFRGKEKQEYGKFDKPFKKRESAFGEKKEFRREKSDAVSDDKKIFRENKFSDNRKSGKPYEKKEFKFGEKNNHHDRPYKKQFQKRKDHSDKGKQSENKSSKHTDGLIRLNKYLSNAGVCSRREADDLIKAGTVSVNGKVVTEMGYRVNPDDKITYGGETLKHERKIYLILNKPKDYITTTDDPQERRTVMELIKSACRERVYPVGRLDRNTTGLLLFTNDGEMTTKLMHPKFGIKKVYHVLLNKNMKPADYARLHEGVELEDGFIKPDDASFTGENKKELGIEIHSGKNRIVRRIFEHLGYEVVKLDRVVFAGLTKKDLPRGNWRFLTEKEVGFLKMIG